jgi:SAM-dependent methyltransferase
MTALLRPFLFAKALYLDRVQRKRMEGLEEETLRKVEELLNANVPIVLELGHRHLRSDDWLTLDQNMYADFFWDYRNGLPFPSDSIEVLYAGNLLQRLSAPQLMYLLKECLRTLKTGGRFFFSVPDAEPILRAYVEKRQFFAADDPAVWKPGWFDTGSRLDQVTYQAYSNGHVHFLFDHENVVCLCQKAGFAHTEFREPEANIDGALSRPDTLYVVASKSS